MLRAFASRLVGSVGSLFAATLVAFIVLRAIPGDPGRALYGRFATAQQLHVLRGQMGLDKPFYEQYLLFVKSLASGNWGFSFPFGEPVYDVIEPRLLASMELALFAFVIALVSSVLLALFATRYPRSLFARMTQGWALVALGLPVFWLGLVLLLVFSVYLGWLPGPGGQLSADTAPPSTITGLIPLDALLTGQFGAFIDSIRHLLLPSIALALGPSAYLFRLLRSNLQEIVRQPFLVVVRSKGMGRWSILWHHALPNAMLPVLTASGLILAELLGGTVLVETVFGWPGVGDLLTMSVVNKDYAVAQIIIVLIAVSYVILNAVVDVLYGVVDPRVRISDGQAAR